MKKALSGRATPFKIKVIIEELSTLTSDSLLDFKLKNMTIGDIFKSSQLHLADWIAIFSTLCKAFITLPRVFNDF